jgi:hypothetical protein
VQIITLLYDSILSPFCKVSAAFNEVVISELEMMSKKAVVV